MKATFFTLSVLATSTLACAPCEQLEKTVRGCTSSLGMPTSLDQAKIMGAQLAMCACTKDNIALLAQCKQCPPNSDLTKQTVIASLENGLSATCSKVMSMTGQAPPTGGEAGAGAGAAAGGDPSAGGLPGAGAGGDPSGAGAAAGGMPAGGMPAGGMPAGGAAGAPVATGTDVPMPSRSVSTIPDSSAVSSAVASATSSAASSASSEASASATASASASASKSAAVGAVPVGASGFAVLATVFGFLAAL